MTHEGFTKEEALETFARTIQIDCPEDRCSALVGELCDTHTVWVHLERVKAAEHMPEPVKPFLHKVEFDENNPNWSPLPEYNAIFLRCQQNFCNDKLRAKGFMTLNQVLEMLDFAYIPEGQTVGWSASGEGDNYIDFGCFNGEGVIGLVNKQSVTLSFNAALPVLAHI